MPLDAFRMFASCMLGNEWKLLYCNCFSSHNLPICLDFGPSLASVPASIGNISQNLFKCELANWQSLAGSELENMKTRHRHLALNPSSVNKDLHVNGRVKMASNKEHWKLQEGYKGNGLDIQPSGVFHFSCMLPQIEMILNMNFAISTSCTVHLVVQEFGCLPSHASLYPTSDSGKASINVQQDMIQLKKLHTVYNASLCITNIYIYK